jgi:hypothetical protein
VTGEIKLRSPVPAGILTRSSLVLDTGNNQDEYLEDNPRSGMDIQSTGACRFDWIELMLASNVPSFPTQHKTGEKTTIYSGIINPYTICCTQKPSQLYSFFARLTRGIRKT